MGSRCTRRPARAGSTPRAARHCCATSCVARGQAARCSDCAGASGTTPRRPCAHHPKEGLQGWDGRGRQVAVDRSTWTPFPSCAGSQPACLHHASTGRPPPLRGRANGLANRARFAYAHRACFTYAPHTPTDHGSMPVAAASSKIPDDAVGACLLRSTSGFAATILTFGVLFPRCFPITVFCPSDAWRASAARRTRPSSRTCSRRSISAPLSGLCDPGKNRLFSFWVGRQFSGPPRRHDCRHAADRHPVSRPYRTEPR